MNFHTLVGAEAITIHNLGWKDSWSGLYYSKVKFNSFVLEPGLGGSWIWIS